MASRKRIFLFIGAPLEDGILQNSDQILKEFSRHEDGILQNSDQIHKEFSGHLFFSSQNVKKKIIPSSGQIKIVKYLKNVKRILITF